MVMVQDWTGSLLLRYLLDVEEVSSLILAFSFVGNAEILPSADYLELRDLNVLIVVSFSHHKTIACIIVSCMPFGNNYL